MTMRTVPAKTRDVKSLTGEADIDVSAAVYTAYVATLTIAPATGAPLEDCWVVFDLDKAATGFAALYTTETLQMIVQRKIDGTNWRGEKQTETTALAGDNADAYSQKLEIGPLGVTQQARVSMKLSAENANDIEFPYVIYYKGSKAPTVTAVAA